MKRGTGVGAVLIVLLLVGIVSAECEYDADFDADEDYVMNTGADCGADYIYDCDDSDKDTFKDCEKNVKKAENSLWRRFVDWITGKSLKEDGNKLSGKIVKSTIRSEPKEEIETEEHADDCAATICLDSDFKEVYCPLPYEECCAKFSECRSVHCAEEFCEGSYLAPTQTYEPETDRYADDYYSGSSDTYGSGQDLDDPDCAEEYHDCYDNGEAVICKGEFWRCNDAFDDCMCGTSDEVSGESAEADVDTSEAGECNTGVYVCERQVLTMSGDVANSKVTCKGTFSECAMQYGGCQCGDSSLTDFPTQYIGEAGEECTEGDEGYWCDWKDRQVPCYMLVDECNEKQNTCYKASGVKIICQGTLNYCSAQYAGECLCGIEILRTGIMNTEAD